jgi:hypothetical protein
MSENFMGGGLPAPEQPEETPSTGRDPKVLIGGGIGLALVAVVGGYLLLGGGGSDSPSAPAAVRPAVTHAAPTTPSASATATGKAPAAIRTFNGDVGRDPFNPLITPPPTTAPPTSAAPNPVATTTPASATPSPGSVVGLPPNGVNVLPTSIPVVPTSIPAPTTTAPAVVVVLKAIAFHGATPYVVVSFGGKSIALKTGDTSAGNLKVVAIAPDDGTATFQLGDQTFDLHIGQSYVD